MGRPKNIEVIGVSSQSTALESTPKQDSPSITTGDTTPPQSDNPAVTPPTSSPNTSSSRITSSSPITSSSRSLRMRTRGQGKTEAKYVLKERLVQRLVKGKPLHGNKVV
eukprot:sb/3477429/